jgi:hypothetical protein
MLFRPSKPLPQIPTSMSFDIHERSTPKRRAYALYRLRLPALSLIL